MVGDASRKDPPLAYSSTLPLRGWVKKPLTAISATSSSSSRRRDRNAMQAWSHWYRPIE